MPRPANPWGNCSFGLVTGTREPDYRVHMDTYCILRTKEAPDPETLSKVISRTRELLHTYVPSSSSGKDAAVTSAHHNRRLFRTICPGRAPTGGRDQHCENSDGRR